MKKCYLLIYSLFCLGIVAKAQYTVLYNFTGTGGGTPEFGAMTVSGGVLYGMTSELSTATGNMFSINTNGTGYTDLYDFTLYNGESPYGSLLLSGGVFYGMTSYGGSTFPYGSGTVFSIATNGTGYAELYHFVNGTAGESPDGSLVLSGGVFYGMTLSGGPAGHGNVFSVNENGSGYADLLDFNGTNGKQPYGSLVISGSVLYGMTFGGGANGYGLIFSINTNGTGYTDMLDFNGTNGSNPYGSLILSGSTLYGMTSVGGINGQGNIFSINTNGTGFKDIFDFNNVDGSGPEGDLLLVGNTLCGLTVYGGATSQGNIFSIHTDGSGFTDLHDFNGTNGSQPQGTLVLSGDVLYGMTYNGGSSGYGVIFGYSVPGLGVNELAATGGTAKLYPNPSKGIFTIQLSEVKSGNIAGATIEIYNMLGEKIYTSTLNAENTTIDISNNAAGTYFYKVFAKTGSLVSEGKLGIQQ